jgi:hypothetical protein
LLPDCNTRLNWFVSQQNKPLVAIYKPYWRAQATSCYCFFIYIFRILFPDLPENGGPLQIRSEKYVDYDSDEETSGVISLNIPEQNER